MALYVSGRQPSLSVGIPGITTNAPVLDITGRIGIGTTNPSADIDLNTIRIRQSIFDTTNFSGSLGYFLTNDATGIKWTAVPPLNNNALFIAQNSNLVGVSSFTGLNFISDGNDLVSISTNSGNSKFADIKISSYWSKSGNTGIYTSKFVGIGSTTPTVALDVIGNSRISGIVTVGLGSTGIVINGNTGIITSISGITTLTFYGNLVGSASTAGYARTAFDIDATGASNLNVAYASTAGIATYSTKSGISTDVIGGIASVTSLFVNTTGISTLGTVKISSGIITATSGVVTYYGDGSKLTNVIASYAQTAGIATYATDAGISTNLKGSVLNVIPYQAGINSTSFLSPGSPGEYLKSNGSTLPPSWQTFPALSINVVDTTSLVTNYPLFVDDTGSTTSLNINKSLFAFVPQSNNPRLGIGSASPSFNLDVSGTGRFTGIVSASGLTISGIVTVGLGSTGIVINGNTGIITSSNPGVSTVTFVGNLTGTASTASFATTAFNVDSAAASKLIVSYAQTAGIATNVIGGIASVTSLFVNTTGISTLGTVKISSGIITATSGVVTYYGDGSKLTGVSGVKVEFQTLVGDPVYPTLANSAGVSSVGIATLGDNALVFVPSNGRLGIGTTNPTEKLDVNGNIRLRSGLRDSTNQLGGPNSILSSDGSNVVWSSINGLGGSEISLGEDNSTPTPQYLIFTNAKTGTAFTERVSPSKLSFIASSGSLGIGTSSPLTPLQVEKYGVKTGFGTFTASVGITTDVDSFLISNTNFKTAEYTVYIESSSSIQAQKVLVMQNGTSAFSQEYAIMYEPTFMISIGATVSGGLCKLQFTPETGTSGLVTYRFARETMI
jgi:hypothetical protein